MESPNSIRREMEKNLFFFQDYSLLIVLRALNGEQMLEKKDFLFKEKVKKEQTICLLFKNN